MVMRKDIPKNMQKWFFLALFTSYVSGISFFTHTHTINHIVYVHSHPHKKGEAKQHTHTNNELHTLDLFYHTTITDDIISDIDLADHSMPRMVICSNFYGSIHAVDKKDNTLLRAPPAA